MPDTKNNSAVEAQKKRDGFAREDKLNVHDTLDSTTSVSGAQETGTSLFLLKSQRDNDIEYLCSIGYNQPGIGTYSDSILRMLAENHKSTNK